MLHIDIHNEQTGVTTRVGTLGEFADLLIGSIGSVATVLFKHELKKKVITALDKVVQQSREGR